MFFVTIRVLSGVMCLQVMSGVAFLGNFSGGYHGSVRWSKANATRGSGRCLLYRLDSFGNGAVCFTIRRKWGCGLLARGQHRALPSQAALDRTSMVQGAGRHLQVIITGGSKGVGYALASRFLASGDSVLICSRNAGHVQQAVRSLQSQDFDGESKEKNRVFGIAVDVSKPEDVRKLGDYALEVFGGNVDCMINNAGQVGTRAKLSELDTSIIRDVVCTNLLGALLCCREAERIMGKTGGHCFTMDGAGSAGNATATYVAYGATKRAVPQMVSSISKELSSSKCKFHVSSPGMVLTDLLLSGNSDCRSRRFFNYLAEEPETVAADLVPRIRRVVLDDRRSGQYVKFLTLPKAFLQIALGYIFGVRKNRHFDERTGERIRVEGEEYNEIGVRRQWRQ